MKTQLSILAAATIAAAGCTSGNQISDVASQHHLAVVDPGHFHAALVTKSPIEALDDTIRLYAPEGKEVEQYLGFIDSYNHAAGKPTSWVIDTVIGDQYLDALAEDSISDIVILAGNNRHKTDYIAAAVKAGKNVLADKPMAIDRNGFDKLVDAYAEADSKGLLIYELMTERYDTINVLTRQLLHSDYVGPLSTDSLTPAVKMTSTHHFFKNVSGSPLMRPEWYYDIEQQGEGIADVTTHLLDLVMWQCFPDEAIDYTTDVEVLDAGHSTTTLTPEQFFRSTGVEIDEPLEVYCNGYILARIKNLTVRIEVVWNFEAPAGMGDSFCATYRFDNGMLQVVQDATTGDLKQIFINKFDTEDVANDEAVSINVPKELRSGHEDHFNLVTGSFLRYLDGQPVPEWERANTLAKYYITTKAVEIARSKD